MRLLRGHDVARARRVLPLRSDARDREVHGQGNEIKYEVTIEAPEVLVEPWAMTPRTMRLNSNPDAGLRPERGNCEVYELEDITSQIRH